MAWPAVAVSVFIGFRPQIQVLLARILELKAGPVSATFDAAVEQAKRVSEGGVQQGEIPAPKDGGPVTFTAHSFEAATTLALTYGRGYSIVLDLTSVDDDTAKRLVDFSAGMTYIGHGSIKRLAPRLFLLSPPTGDQTGGAGGQ